MYSVSSDYLKAFRSSSRVDRVTGVIMLQDDTDIQITDDIIVRNKLSITRKVCTSQMKIGTFNSAELAMTIRCKDAYEHNWGGAIVRLYYELRTAVASDGTETWEQVPLGRFYIDGQQTKRIHDVVTLYGYDASSKLDVDFTGSTSGISLYGLFRSVASRGFSGTVAITEEEFSEFPNSSIIPDTSSEQLQSCRDVIMWIAQAVGGYALIDSQNRLTIKRYVYPLSGISESNGYRFIRAAERTKIEFSDTETYLKYLTAYCNGETKVYTNAHSYTSSEGDRIAYGAYSLPKNPLFQSLTEDEQDAANKAYLTQDFAPTRYIKSTGFVDPSIELLDVVGFAGGNIDISNGTLSSVVTEIKWKYRNVGTITCMSFDEYEPDASVAVTADDGSEVSSVSVKSQTEKRIDGLEARLNKADTGTYTTVIAFNSTGFDLTFDVGGKSVTNEFSVAEDSAGNITSITNDTAERTIKVTYD